MASIAYSRTDPYVFITQKSHSCVLDLLAYNTEYSFSIRPLSSCEGHEVSNITPTPSQSPSIPSVYTIVSGGTRSVKHHSQRMLPLINLTYFSLLPHRLWMPIYLLEVFNNSIIISTFHMACFHHTCMHRKAHICFILHLHVCHYLAPGSIEDLLSGPPPERSCTCLAYMVFIDLEKAYDRVPRQEVWRCVMEKGVSEKYVRIIQDMYEGARTRVNSSVGLTGTIPVGVWLHQVYSLSPYLFATIMDVLARGIKDLSP